MMLSKVEKELVCLNEKMDTIMRLLMIIAMHYDEKATLEIERKTKHFVKGTK